MDSVVGLGVGAAAGGGDERRDDLVKMKRRLLKVCRFRLFVFPRSPNPAPPTTKDM